MAGHRRTRPAGAPLAPPIRRSRKENRRHRLAARFADATTSRERLKIAFDYAIGAASRRHPDPTRASVLVDNAAAQLIELGDQLLELQARERLHFQRRSHISSRGGQL